MKIKNKIILCVCSFILMICTMFSFVPISKADNLVVKADTVIPSSTFTSSNILVPVALSSYSYSNGVGTSQNPGGSNSYSTSTGFEFLFSFFSFRLRNNPDTGILEVAPNFYNVSIYDNNMAISSTGNVIPQELTYVNYFYRDGSNRSYKYDYTDTYLPLNEWGEIATTSLYNFYTQIIVTGYVGEYVGSGYIADNTSSGSLRGIRFCIEYSSLDFNISKMSYVTLELDTAQYSDSRSMYLLTYYDALGNFIRFRIYCGKFASGSIPNVGTIPFDYQTKTYYFNNSSLNDSESYNQGYQAGQQSGYNNGFEVGRSEGYNAGYNVGQDVGYNNGFSDGVEDSNQYTFLNLISATIDAPITYFQELFNFELLGVNLQGFLTGLFTLCVIVTIIKLCLGG